MVAQLEKALDSRPQHTNLTSTDMVLRKSSFLLAARKAAAERGHAAQMEDCQECLFALVLQLWLARFEVTLADAETKLGRVLMTFSKACDSGETP